VRGVLPAAVAAELRLPPVPFLAADFAAGLAAAGFAANFAAAPVDLTAAAGCLLGRPCFLQCIQGRRMRNDRSWGAQQSRWELWCTILYGGIRKAPRHTVTAEQHQLSDLTVPRTECNQGHLAVVGGGPGASASPASPPSAASPPSSASSASATDAAALRAVAATLAPAPSASEYMQTALGSDLLPHVSALVCH
jgi:hypothetical protein